MGLIILSHRKVFILKEYLDDSVFRFSLVAMIIILIIGLFMAFAGVTGDNPIQASLNTISVAFFLFIGINVVFDLKRIANVLENKKD